MFTHLRLIVNSSTFEISGKFDLDGDVLAMIAMWYAAVRPDDEKIQAEAARLKTATASLKDAVEDAAHL